jgi:hypothetical protein
MTLARILCDYGTFRNRSLYIANSDILFVGGCWIVRSIVGGDVGENGAVIGAQ